MLRMEYLVSRTAKDGTKLWQYRREVAKPLRSILGCREIKHSLGTGGPRRCSVSGGPSPRSGRAEDCRGRRWSEVVGYRRVQGRTGPRTGRLAGRRGLDYYLTSLLEQRNLDPHR
jgi:hypothetical protein